MNDWQEAGERHAIRNRLRQGKFPAMRDSVRWSKACRLAEVAEAFDKKAGIRNSTIRAIQEATAPTGDFSEWLERQAA